MFTLLTTWKRGRLLLAERLKGERLELLPFLESLAASMPTRVAGTSVKVLAGNSQCQTRSNNGLATPSLC